MRTRTDLRRLAYQLAAHAVGRIEVEVGRVSPFDGELGALTDEEQKNVATLVEAIAERLREEADAMIDSSADPLP